METRNHCSGAGGRGGGERGRERSPGGRRARLWLRSRLFSFFVHYLFRLRPRPCCRSGRSRPAPLARCLPRAQAPRAPGNRAAPPGRAGTRAAQGPAAGLEEGSGGRLPKDPRTLSPPSAWAVNPGPGLGVAAFPGPRPAKRSPEPRASAPHPGSPDQLP